MPIDVLFVGMLESLARDALKHGIREAIRAISEQEILETDLNRLISRPFRSAYAHLQNAELEIVSDVRRKEHVEYARLDFIDASEQDAPLPAARAAFYVGLCHHLLGETRQELFWYQRSLELLSKIENGLKKKKSEKQNSVMGKGAAAVGGVMGKAAPWYLLIPGIEVGAVVLAYHNAEIANLDRQILTTTDHRRAVESVIDVFKGQDPLAKSSESHLS